MCRLTNYIYNRCGHSRHAMNFLGRCSARVQILGHEYCMVRLGQTAEDTVHINSKCAICLPTRSAKGQALRDALDDVKDALVEELRLQEAEYTVFGLMFFDTLETIGALSPNLPPLGPGFPVWDSDLARRLSAALVHPDAAACNWGSLAYGLRHDVDRLHDIERNEGRHLDSAETETLFSQVRALDPRFQECRTVFEGNRRDIQTWCASVNPVRRLDLGGPDSSNQRYRERYRLKKAWVLSLPSARRALDLGSATEDEAVAMILEEVQEGFTV